MAGLVVHKLKQGDPGQVPAEAAAIDTVRQATVGAQHKRDLLEPLWRNGGPEALLSIGREVRTAAYDPIWSAALRSSSPAILFDKWRRFEVYAHSRNRVRIDQADEHRASFRRFTVDGGTPSAPENLLICGVIVALLEEIGCKGLVCTMPLETGSPCRIVENGFIRTPPDPSLLATASWTIEWREFAPRREAATLDREIPQVPLPKHCDPSVRTTVDKVLGVLARDAACQWTVGALARFVGLSKRSLQRRLGEAGFSFSSLVRLARIHEACRLLEHGDAPITAVGFCSGFSDSAHFSRDFRASMGMTPSEYRSVHRDG